MMNPPWKISAGLAILLTAVPFSLPAASGGSARDPIYIGAQACAECHDTAESGHQFSQWRLTPHAKAYAALALPEAKPITDLSGITEEPH